MHATSDRACLLAQPSSTRAPNKLTQCIVPLETALWTLTRTHNTKTAPDKEATTSVKDAQSCRTSSRDDHKACAELRPRPSSCLQDSRTNIFSLLMTLKNANRHRRTRTHVPDLPGTRLAADAKIFLCKHRATSEPCKHNQMNTSDYLSMNAVARTPSNCAVLFSTNHATERKFLGVWQAERAVAEAPHCEIR